MTVASQGRQRDTWNHTCAVMAQMAEINRDPKKRARPFTADEFHPMRKRVVARISVTDLAASGGI